MIIQDLPSTVNKTRRHFAKYLCLFPFLGTFIQSRTTAAEQQLNDNFVLVNGWILKKSDLTDNLG